MIVYLILTLITFGTMAGCGIFVVRENGGFREVLGRLREPERPPLWPAGQELWYGELEQDRAMDETLAIPMEPPPDHQIELWTPLEREIFGHNETLAVIDRIDKELRDIEWKRHVDAAKAANEEMPDLSSLRARPEPKRLRTNDILEGRELLPSPEFETEVVRSWDGRFERHVTTHLPTGRRAMSEIHPGVRVTEEQVSKKHQEILINQARELSVAESADRAMKMIRAGIHPELGPIAEPF